MDLKIFIAYHKESFYVTEKGYYPLFVGASLINSTENFKSLKKKHINKIFFDNDFINKNSNNSISSENRSLNELTGIYWIYKNYQNIGNPECIGFMHYRRFFLFKEELSLTHPTWLPNSNIFWYKDYSSFSSLRKIEDAKLLLKKYDIITTKKYNAKKLKTFNNYKEGCKTRFYEIADFDPQIYDYMEELVLKHFPSYKVEIQQLRKEPEHYLFNMFLMKKEIFMEYCFFIFTILPNLAEKVRFENRLTEKRAPGFLAEFLTSMFISHKARVDKAKIKELDVAFIGYTKGYVFPIKKISFNLINLYILIRISLSLVKSDFLKIHSNAVKELIENSLKCNLISRFNRYYYLTLVKLYHFIKN